MALTRAKAGVALRLIGPVIQVFCLIGLFWPAPEVPSPRFDQLRQICLVGFGVGLLLAALGLGLSMMARRSGRDGERGPLSP